MDEANEISANLLAEIEKFAMSFERQFKRDLIGIGLAASQNKHCAQLFLTRRFVVAAIPRKIVLG